MKKLLIGLIIFWFFGALELNAKDIVLNCEGWGGNVPLNIQLDLENNIAIETHSEGTYESQILSLDKDSISIRGCEDNKCILYNVFTNTTDVEFSLYENNTLLAQGKMNCEYNKDDLLISIKDSIQKSLLASINLKKSLCAKIGFEDNSESMANCVFQLMMDENEKKLLDEKNTKIAEANKKKEEELKKQTMIIEQEIIRQKKAAQGAAIDQFLIDLINIFGGIQPQTTRTIPSGTICHLATWKVVSNAKICSYYCPSGNYAMQLRNYEVCPQQVRR